MRRKRTRGERNLIMGRNCVREVLRAVPERVQRLILGRDDVLPQEVLDKARGRGIEIEIMHPKALSELLGSDSHQNVAAFVHPRDELSVKDLIGMLADQQRVLLLLLDSLNDPQNLGAVLRAAECFGSAGVVFSWNRGAPLTPTVAKSSVGAIEILPIVQVSNLVEAARGLKEAGFWLAGADVSNTAQNAYDFQFPDRTALVLGAEGEGIRELLRRELDFHLIIPMHGVIDSLNVSQAAAVFCSLFAKQGK